MTEDEFQFAVDSVRKSLERSSLDWIVKQVDETLRLGKPAVRTVLEEERESPDTLHLPSVQIIGKAGTKPTRRKTTIPTTESYSKKEELGLLLEAIQRTAIATLDMQSYVLERVAIHVETATPDQEISFERDGTRSSSIPYENQTDAKVRIETLREAIGLLKEKAK
jgi:hypothetical protein